MTLHFNSTRTAHTMADLTLAFLILISLISIGVLIHTIYAFVIQKVQSSKTLSTVVIVTISLLTLHVLASAITQIFRNVSLEGSAMECKIYVTLASCLYYTGKASLFSFYTLRAYKAFQDTSHEYKRSNIVQILIFINSLSIISCMSWLFIQLPETEIVYDADLKIYYCVTTASTEEGYKHGNMPHTYYTVYLVFAETLSGAITMWLFTNRLSRMSKHAFMHRQQSHWRRQIEEIDDIYSEPKGLETLDPTKQNEVELWHLKTKNINFMLLVISKLLLLFFITWITTIISSVLFLTVWGKVYAFDSCVNLLCVYLSFNYSDWMWENLCCGNYCIQCSFPWVKVWTFTTCIKRNAAGHCIKCNFCSKEKRRMRKMVRIEYKMYINPPDERTCACCWRILEKSIQSQMETSGTHNQYVELAAL